MRKLLFGIVLVIAGVVGYQYFNNRSIQLKAMDKNEDAGVFLANTSFRSVKSAINSADTLEQLNDSGLNEELINLPKQLQDKARPYLGLKKASLLFKQGELYLEKAKLIEKALEAPETPPVQGQPLPERPPLNRLTLENLKKSFDAYENARKEIEKYIEIGDNDFDYNLGYLKGEIYFRYLQYLSTQETSEELFNQTLLNYKQALKYKPSDIDSVINIELLIKNQMSLMGNASRPSNRRKQMLNLKRYGLGHSSGN